jgi:predicted RNA-binding Zn ribbon-like protein
MASVVVDGLVLPISLDGQPVLDFCNTRARWTAATPKEYLVSHAHLTVWTKTAGLIPAAEVTPLSRAATSRPGEATAVVKRAIRFRSALYAVLTGPATAGDWAAVNAEIGAASGGVALVAGTPAVWTVTGSGLDLPLRAAVWAAAGFLTTPAAGAVGACPSDICGWLFTIPTGRRRWCSMAWCGNRAKVRRHAERARAGRSG